MKKFKIIFPLFLLLTLQICAQNPWERISPNPIESLLNETTRIPEGIANESNLHCYPNPVKDIIYADFRLVNNTYPGKLIFFDIFGRRITEIENQERPGNVKLNVSHRENGVYFIISVSCEQILGKGKFIKIE